MYEKLQLSDPRTYFIRLPKATAFVVGLLSTGIWASQCGIRIYTHILWVNVICIAGAVCFVMACVPLVVQALDLFSSIQGKPGLRIGIAIFVIFFAYNGPGIGLFKLNAICAALIFLLTEFYVLAWNALPPNWLDRYPPNEEITKNWGKHGILLLNGLILLFFLAIAFYSNAPKSLREYLANTTLHLQLHTAYPTILELYKWLIYSGSWSPHFSGFWFGNSMAFLTGYYLWVLQNVADPERQI